ncbi:DIAP3 protein, partial [Cinclus mexicanus]|nr:DIAP3 protein [Cinclus mexicanus]
PSSPPARAGRENKGLRRKGPPGTGSAGGPEEAVADSRKPKFHVNIKTLTDDVLDRFASIRIPRSKKERPPLPHMKQSHSTDWSSTPMDQEDFATKTLTEREIIALFEKMM